jgi:hypothetical protein
MEYLNVKLFKDTDFERPYLLPNTKQMWWHMRNSRHKKWDYNMKYLYDFTNVHRNVTSLPQFPVPDFMKIWQNTANTERQNDVWWTETLKMEAACSCETLETHLLSWEWRPEVPQKLFLRSTGIHCATYEETVIFFPNMGSMASNITGIS